MKKLFVLALMLLAGRLLMAQIPNVRVENHLSKYEQLTRQTGVQCKITDYALNTQIFHDMEISVRSVEMEGVEPSSKQGPPMVSTCLFRCWFSCRARERTP